MSENTVLYLTSLLLLALIIFSAKYKKSFFIVNLILFLVYTLPMYYGLFFDVGNGSALVYWAYLLFLTLLHIIITTYYLVFYLLKSKSSSGQ